MRDLRLKGVQWGGQFCGRPCALRHRVDRSTTRDKAQCCTFYFISWLNNCCNCCKDNVFIPKWMFRLPCPNKPITHMNLQLITSCDTQHEAHCAIVNQTVNQ